MYSKAMKIFLKVETKRKVKTISINKVVKCCEIETPSTLQLPLEYL